MFQHSVCVVLQGEMQGGVMLRVWLRLLIVLTSKVGIAF